MARRNGIRRLIPALLLAALACLALVSPAAALDLGINPADYFYLSYDPVTFDKSQVVPGDIFHTTITGKVVCSQDIPLPVNRAEVTMKVVARHATTGDLYDLNPGFTVDIDPFPRQEGETFEINLPLSLQFPPGAAPGEYQVFGQLVEARVRITFVWTDVSNYLPPEQAMGKVSVIAAPAPPGTTTILPPPGTTTITTSRPLPPGGVPLWVLPLAVIILVVAVIGTIVFLVLRRRGG
jgi:hypothetical protein